MKDFKLVEEGDYNLTIAKVEIKPSKNVKGCNMANIKFAVDGGEFDKFVIYQNFIVKHPTSDKAVEFGTTSLDKLLKAVGHEGYAGILTDDDGILGLPLELDGKSISGRVYVKESNNPKYRDQNQVTKFTRAF